MLVSIAQAQRSKIEVGLFGGPGVATIYKSSHAQPDVAGIAGVAVQVNTRKVFGFRMELAYERKGFQYPGAITDENGNTMDVGPVHFQCDYLTLPLLFRFQFGKIFRPYLEVGGFGSYLLNAQTKGPTALNTDTTYSTKTGVNRFDAGLALGLGFTVQVTRLISVLGGFRNHLSLVNNIDKKPSGSLSSIDFSKRFHNSSTFTLGLTFHLVPF